ncbi:hypothetical protein A3F39_02090 [Candidatus Berkelbacteria bacterium RIFCSPHIGHO2_12_FULL_50_11]|nr:MAG: hypothetical protein A3F39_02090 [Candidatus Berkelbacteria bacterium RIFCSPHIGHO2_12_FULL_50_11]
MRTKFFAISLVAFLAFSPNLALAQEVSVTESGATTEVDLGVVNPGILPTNPFYFFKEFGRTIRRAFTVDPIAKANYELKVVNEKAAELQELKELGADESALEKAITNYEEDVNRLRNRLEGLEETSANPNVDELMDQLAERVVRHQELFDSLMAEHGELQDILGETQNNLDEIASSAVEKIDTPEKFKERILEKIEGEVDNPEEVMWFGLLIRVADGVKSEEAKEKLAEARDELMERFGDFGNEEEEGFVEGEGACIELYAPVCGVDDKTYSNSCFAGAAGVQIASEGGCQTEE